jgi:hypothetical protein
MAQCCPPAPRSRAKRAAVIACAAASAVALSATMLRTSSGAPVRGSAWEAAIPESAWITLS